MEMKLSLLVVLFGLLCVSLGDSPLTFNPKDPQWKNFKGEGVTFEKVRNILMEYESVPQVKKFIAMLDEGYQLYHSVNLSEVALDPDTFRTIPEIIRDKGYPAEHYNFVTSDGYILETFRVPHGRSTGRGGPPVLLSHGLMDSAGTWVMNYPDESLPYILADAGYDVWMNSVRACKYGDTHRSMNPETDDEFWDVSFDEQGKIDIPELLDFIKNATGYEKVAVIGHSQGGTQFFAGLYFTPELADKLNIFIGLAPALYFDKNINILIHVMSHLFMGEFLQLIGVDEFFPLSDELHRGLAQFCTAFPRFVEAFLGAIMGYNPGETNYDRYGVMCYQSLGFTSMMNMVHWAQLVRTEEYKAYDFGTSGNQEHYGQRDAPLFVLDELVPRTLPIAIIYGSLDTLVSPWDSEDVINDLPYPPVYTKHIYRYQHMDFVWSLSAREEIYEDILGLLKDYTKRI